MTRSPLLLARWPSVPQCRMAAARRVAALLVLLATTPFTGTALAASTSAFTTRPDDPSAISLTAPGFAVHGDGQADDSAAIQAAIDKAAQTSVWGGIELVPAGR